MAQTEQPLPPDPRFDPAKAEDDAEGGANPPAEKDLKPPPGGSDFA